MFSILGAVLFGVIAIMTVLVAYDLPLGEFTMGGQHKIWQLCQVVIGFGLNRAPWLILIRRRR